MGGARRALPWALALAVALASTPAASQPKPEVFRTAADLLQHRAAIAAQLVQPIARCVQRRDTGHDAFRGCVDWHSAVHGVLGLVIHGKVTGNKRYDDVVAKTLAPPLIARERQYLKSNPGFEMPYGRAWFLRLAVEHERRFKSNALRAMADEMADSLRAFVESQRSDLLEGSYESVSWALINLIDYALATDNRELAEFATRHARTILMRTGPGCSYQLEDGEFMSICLQRTWLAAKSLSEAAFTIWHRDFLRGVGLPEPIARPSSAHHYGLNFSRSWALAALLRRTKLPEYDAALAAHVSAGYRPRSNWDGDYMTVAHWVAQFGMMALLLLDDDLAAAPPPAR
jgi:hypothetical protein